MDDFLLFDRVSKRFDQDWAVRELTLAICQGEVFSLLGPSGCGKTTLLRICAGFEQPDSGRVLLQGRDITALPPHKRPVNTVFQNYALFPHLTLRQNVAFGLKLEKLPRRDIDRQVEAMLELVQLREQGDKKPHQISGGQKQRVAIARALVKRPKVLLLDEPLAALDLKLRKRMLIELDEIHDEVGTTFVYVTHDQSEAMSLSDRLAVMNDGQIEQVGTPVEVYEAPESSFTAAFIGDTNFFEGRVVAQEGDYCRLAIEGLGEVWCYNDRGRRQGELVYLSVRPEKMRLSRQPLELGRNRFSGRVEDKVYLGGESRFWVRVGEYRLAVAVQHSRYLLDQQPLQWGEEVALGWHEDDGYMLQRYAEEHEALLSLPPEDEA
ncbi:MAG: ABC transporter ATP-binding protein [Desulfuromonas thiophila]|jgi:spermidine/putrescine transport system ATP-binding protein|nr:ABC transporter ATP-binding protein [Desulfuromonas thiophila]